MDKVKTNPRGSKLETHDALTKCRAVLSVWTEARKPSAVCRELGLKWVTFSYWQKRALEGMLQALEPRVNLSANPALSPRLMAMLEREERRLKALPLGITARKLTQRLQRIQETKSGEKKEEPVTTKS